MRVAVIDYAGGNLASAARALAEAAPRSGIAAALARTAEPAPLRPAPPIVPPGPGAVGLADAMCARVAAGAPFLGICVGMQLMAERGREHGTTDGFGWVRGEVARMETRLRLPQMGWNALRFAPGAHALLDGVAAGEQVYFVHSYALRGGDGRETIATVDYDGARVAMVARGNVAGTQFHVEKSQEVGLRILANFLRWTP